MQSLKAKITELSKNLQQKLHANKKNQVIYSIAIVIGTMLLLFLVLFLLTRPQQTKEDSQVSITPTEKPEPTITRNPTKKVSPTIASATIAPTKVITPTVTSAPSVTPTTAPTTAPTSTPDTEAPTLQQMTGPEHGSTVEFSNFCFPMMYRDNRNSSSEIFVRYRFDSDTWSEWKKDYSPCYSNINNGEHTFVVQAKDTSGNESSVTTRTFNVNVAAATPSITPTQTP